MAKILVVDDDDLILGMLRDTIDLLGHRAISMTNGDDALNYLQSGAQVDMLITDVVMPGLRGDKLVSIALKSPEIRHFPILILSGKYMQDELTSLLRHPRVEFIRKPFRMGDLLASINVRLNRTSHLPDIYVSQEFSPAFL